MHYGILQVCFKERQDHANIPFFYFPRHADLVTGQGKGTRYAIAVPGWTPPTVEQARAAQPLGQHSHSTIVAAGRAQDIQRLALQLLENAATLDPATPLLQPPGACATATHPDWSH